MELWSRFLALVRVSYILNLLKSDGKSRCNVFLLVLLAKKNYNMIFHHFSRGIGNNHSYPVHIPNPKSKPYTLKTSANLDEQTHCPYLYKKNLHFFIRVLF